MPWQSVTPWVATPSRLQPRSAPQAFAKLLLLDPVILPEIAYQGAMEPSFRAAAPEPLGFRRSDVRPFREPPAFDAWDRAVLRDIATSRYADLVLACPPEVEASIYDQSTEQQSNIYPEIAALDLPVHVVRFRVIPTPMAASTAAPLRRIWQPAFPTLQTSI